MSSVAQNVPHSIDKPSFVSTLTQTTSRYGEHSYTNTNNQKLIESLTAAIHQLNTFVMEPPTKFNLVDAIISKATSARNELVSFLSYLNSISNVQRSRTNQSEVSVNDLEGTPRSGSATPQYSASSPPTFYGEYGSYSAPPPSQKTRPHADSIAAQSQPDDGDVGYGYFSDMHSEYQANSHSEYPEDSETYDTAMGVVAGILTPSASPAPQPSKFNKRNIAPTSSTPSPEKTSSAINAFSTRPVHYAKSESEMLGKRTISSSTSVNERQPPAKFSSTPKYTTRQPALREKSQYQVSRHQQQPLPHPGRQHIAASHVRSKSATNTSPIENHLVASSQNSFRARSQSTNYPLVGQNRDSSVPNNNLDLGSLAGTRLSLTPPPVSLPPQKKDSESLHHPNTVDNVLTPSPRHPQQFHVPIGLLRIPQSPSSHVISQSKPPLPSQPVRRASRNDVSADDEEEPSSVGLPIQPGQMFTGSQSSSGSPTDSPTRSCDTSENSVTGSGSDSGSAGEEQDHHKMSDKHTAKTKVPSEQTPSWSALCGQKSTPSATTRKLRTRQSEGTTTKLKSPPNSKTRSTKGQTPTKPRRVTQSNSKASPPNSNNTNGNSTTPRRANQPSSSVSETNRSSRTRQTKQTRTTTRNGKRRGSGDDATLMRRVFVSNLPHHVSDAEIREAFNPCGEIKHTVWFPSRTDGRFYGSGLITFKDNAGAAHAVSWNKQVVLGRTIRVEYSACQDPIKEKPPGCCTTYLNNVPPDITEDRIRQVFKHCGKIVRVRFHERDGQRTGGAFVQFQDTNAADRALLMHGSIVDGFPLYVDYQRY